MGGLMSAGRVAQAMRGRDMIIGGADSERSTPTTYDDELASAPVKAAAAAADTSKPASSAVTDGQASAPDHNGLEPPDYQKFENVPRSGKVNLPGPFDQAWAAYKERGGVPVNKKQVSSFAADTEKAQLGNVPNDVKSKKFREEFSGPEAAVEWGDSYQKEYDLRRRFESRFKNSPLEGSYNDVVAAAKKYRVPPIVAFSVIAQETGNGTTIKGNNLSGVKVGKDSTVHKIYNTLSEGIDESVRILAKNYNLAGGDLEKMRDIHAPVRGKVINDPHKMNNDWLPNVRQIKRFFEAVETPPARRTFILKPESPMQGVVVDENRSLRDKSPWQGQDDLWDRRYVFPKERR